MNYRYLNIKFLFQHEENIHMYELQFNFYINHLIEHEDFDNILTYLKINNWTNNFFVKAIFKFFELVFFTITITFIENEFKEFKKVVRVVFQYISLIKHILSQKRIFNEVSKMINIDFKFQEKNSTSSFTIKRCQFM